MLYSDKEKVISDVTPHAARVHRDKDGVRAKGGIPRDWEKFPQGCYRFPKDHPDKEKRGKSAEVGMHAVEDLKAFDASEFPAMIAQLEAEKSRLSDFRMRGNGGAMIPARDQNGRGYCWRHSGTSAHLVLRARDEMPYLDFSAYAGACMIKQFADEGGWGAQGLADIMSRGDPTSEFWPQRSVSRSNDNAKTWANAKKHRITEGFIDMGAPEYNRNLTFNQVITCLLSRIPVVVDFNWWSHSVCAIDAVSGTSVPRSRKKATGKLMTLKEHEAHWGVNNPVTGGIGIRILNSWGDSWSDHGMGILTGSKAIPDGATAPRAASFAVN